MESDIDLNVQVTRSVRSKWRKWLRRIIWGMIFTVIICAMLVLAFIIITNYRGETARNRILARLKQRKLPINLSYLANEYGSPEDSDDGTRFYLAAFELAQYPEKSIEELSYFYTLERPKLCEPIENDLANKIKRFIHTQQECLALIKTASQYKKYFYNFDWYDLNSRGIHLLNGIKRALRVLHLLSLYEQASDNPDKALEACTAILDMNQSLNNEPFIIVNYVRYANGGTAFGSLEQILSRTTPDVNALQNLRLKFLVESESINLQAMFKTEIVGLAEELCYIERYIARNAFLAEQFLSSEQYSSRVKISREIPIEDIAQDIALPSKSKFRFYLNLSYAWSTICPGVYKEMFVEKIERALKKYDDADASPNELATKANHILAENKDDDSNDSSWADTILRFIEYRALMKVVATALSVESYRAKYGYWPKKLTDLKDDIPVDPFDGNDLKYKITDDGCVIYSIGKNQKDDSGEKDRDSGKDDIVFRLFDTQKRNVR